MAQASQKTKPIQPTRLLVIACGMIAREVLAVKEQLGLDHLDLTCLPAEFHFYPGPHRAGDGQGDRQGQGRRLRHIFVGYADCGTGGLLDRICEKHGVERMAGPHCFAFYQGRRPMRRSPTTT